LAEWKKKLFPGRRDGGKREGRKPALLAAAAAHVERDPSECGQKGTQTVKERGEKAWDEASLAVLDEKRAPRVHHAKCSRNA